MLTSTNFSGLFTPRFARNFIPIPATSKIKIGELAPDFLLPDVTNKTTVRLSEYRGKKPVVLAFTRIFTEHQYCPLCYPHIKELNQNYEQLVEAGAEVLMIASTDSRQTKQVVKDLEIKMPLLSNPDCDVFRTYETGQALGAPLPAQFIVDRDGKIRFKHLFSFLDPNANSDKLTAALAAL
jgi:peroxiredoxin